MLSIYRRHKAECAKRIEEQIKAYQEAHPNERGNKFRGFLKDLDEKSCRCSVWVRGTLEGEPYPRRSLKTKSWQRAERIIREIENGKRESQQPKMTVAAAMEKFVADCESRNLTANTLQKYRRLGKNLETYFRDEGIPNLNQVSTDAVRGFRASWTLSPRTGVKELQRLRSFLNFCVQADWITKNPAKSIKAPEIDVAPTLPFSAEEQKRIRNEAVKLSRGDGRIPPDSRLPVFIDLLLETGLRIGDAGLLQTSEISNRQLLLHTRKSRGAKAVWMPLSPGLLAGLDSITSKGGYYFINSDSISPATVAEYWRVRIKRVCTRAKLPKAHPHQFRDTASVNWLLNGVDIPTVAALLGNTPRIVEKHYAPWVPARQALLTSAVQKAWNKPALARVK